MAKTYTVKQGDTIQDVAFNVSGSLAGIDPILEKNTPTNIPPADWKAMQYRQEPPAKNFMESYTPALRTNQILDVEGIDIYNLQTLQRPPFNSSMDVKEEVEAEISRLFKATAEGGRALISALAPEAMGVMRSNGTFLRDTFYNSPYTVQCLFRTPPKYKYIPSPEAMIRGILDTSGASNFPRIDIKNPSQGIISLVLYNNQAAMYSYPVFWDYLYSVVFISNGAKVYAYINNNLVNSQDKNWVSYTSYLTLGGYGSNNRPAVDFMGEVICARWFDRALTEEEMTALQNGVRPQDYIVPPALKLSCVAEYIPQNLIPSEEDSSKPAMWLDSAKQMPPDISTPPLLRKSAGGYDLVVNDNPKIGREPIHKPTYDFKGAYTANGAFRGQRISTRSLDDGTLECYFKTGDDIHHEQCVFSMADNMALPRLTIITNKLLFATNDFSVKYPCEPNTTYHVVLRYALQENLGYIFLNGIKISGTFKLGRNGMQKYIDLGTYGQNDPILLKGEIYHFRDFNTHLTEAQALMLWNGGDPASFVVDAAMKASCTREYLPQNMRPRSDDPTKAGYWWSSHKQMPVNGVLEPLSAPPAEWPNTNLDYYNYPSIIKQ
nr:MAG: Sialidase, N-terminal domain [Bacteriophage sp.]